MKMKKSILLVFILLVSLFLAAAARQDGVDLRGQYKSTMGDMMNISVAINSYILDHGKAPQAESISELQVLLVPYYIRTLPMQDVWGNLYHYRIDPRANEQKWTVHYYWLGSGGSDGIFLGFNQIGDYQDLNGQDLIIANQRPMFSCKPVMPLRTID